MVMLTVALIFYVAPNGNDSWSGTLAEPNGARTDGPFATIARARDAVRAARKNPQQSAEVIIRGGSYYLAAPLVFAPQDSHTTYKAFPKERPVISGGRVITGLAKGSDGRWRTKIDSAAAGQWDFNELFVNGQRRPRARHPNEGYLRVDKAGPDNRTSFTFKPGDLKKHRNLGDVEIVLLHDWSISRVRVAEVDEAANTVKLADPVGPGAPGLSFFTISNWEPHPRYFVENALELLDSPGEWYLDRAGGELTYWPLEAETPEKTELIAPALERLVGAEPGNDQVGSLEALVLDGLTFSHCLLPRPGHGYAGSQACFHDLRGPDGKSKGSARMPAAIELKHARDCLLLNCRVEHVGGTGISIGRNSSANAIRNCQVSDIGGNGVMIGEAGASGPDLCRNNSVAGSRIQHCGVTYFGAVGVWVGITDGTVIKGNEISDLPYSGVSVGWSWNVNPTLCANNKVADNHIHHVMQILSDGGGIYTLGRQPGTELKGNVIHDVPRNAGRAGSNGMFIDEGSSEILIDGNTIYRTDRSPIRFHKATRDTVRNNVLACPRGVPAFEFNATDAKTITFEANQTPDAATFKPPASQPAVSAPTESK